MCGQKQKVEAMADGPQVARVADRGKSAGDTAGLLTTLSGLLPSMLLAVHAMPLLHSPELFLFVLGTDLHVSAYVSMASWAILLHAHHSRLLIFRRKAWQVMAMIDMLKRQEL